MWLNAITPSFFFTQKLVTSLERSRSAMVEDLAMVSSQNENLKKQVESLLPFKTKLNVCEHVYMCMCMCMCMYTNAIVS